MSAIVLARHTNTDLWMIRESQVGNRLTPPG
jgi:hypothetical protein